MSKCCRWRHIIFFTMQVIAINELAKFAKLNEFFKFQFKFQALDAYNRSCKCMRANWAFPHLWLAQFTPYCRYWAWLVSHCSEHWPIGMCDTIHFYQSIQHCMVLFGADVLSVNPAQYFIIQTKRLTHCLPLSLSASPSSAISDTNQCSCFLSSWRPLHFSPFNLFQRYLNRRRLTSIVPMHLKYWNFVRVSWTIVRLMYSSTNRIKTWAMHTRSM